MSTEFSHLPNEAIEVATADWIARRDAGFTSEDRALFAQWLAQDARHAQAWARHQKMWALLDRPRAGGRAEGMVEELRRRSRRRRFQKVMYAGVSLAAVMIIVAWLGVLTPLDRRGAPDVLVVTPERRVLEDGTQVDLRSGAVVVAEFTPEQRRVRLERGEAHFHVTSNPERPFVVVAQDVAVRAVGTAFAVSLESENVDVVVTEGKVAVESVPLPRVDAAPSLSSGVVPAPVSVGAGERVVVDASVQSRASATVPVVVALPAAEMEERLAWRRVRLEFTGTPLAQALELMNQYNTTRFVIEDPSLAQIEVSGYFRANNTESFLQLLEGSLGINARRQGEVVYLSKPKRIR